MQFIYLNGGSLFCFNLDCPPLASLYFSHMHSLICSLFILPILYLGFLRASEIKGLYFELMDVTILLGAWPSPTWLLVSFPVSEGQHIQFLAMCLLGFDNRLPYLTTVTLLTDLVTSNLASVEPSVNHYSLTMLLHPLYYWATPC